ncbi:hypothetical protein RAY_60 [Erwinia phage vB_EamM_RAY]|uniref:Uncharacterized protein n=1 Tax=Erwinia phage vB_EamM_RAY TaxID=1815987 RepID=A0A173GDR4_9CAUD|nr:hypothetical protein FDH98_gp060 [Erwinia phage vB_EamM_RAY]ANH51841.1 hypothetical protein RAY_60 [Erwinia phage vB_EamM_RAY]
MNLYLVSDSRYTPPGDFYNNWLVHANSRDSAAMLCNSRCLVDTFEIGSLNYNNGELIMMHKTVQHTDEPRLKQKVGDALYYPLTVSPDSSAFDRIIGEIVNKAASPLPEGVSVDRLLINADSPEALFFISRHDFGASRCYYKIPSELDSQISKLLDFNKGERIPRTSHEPVVLSWRSRLSLMIARQHDDAYNHEKLEIYRKMAFDLVATATVEDSATPVALDPDQPDFKVWMPGIDEEKIHQALDTLGAPRQLGE